MYGEYTPDWITELEDNEIFVFCSNLAGAHGGGAARLAYQRFGAVWGCFHEVYVREVTIGYLGQTEEDLKHKVGVFVYDALEDRDEYNQELLGWIDFTVPQSLKDSAEENAKDIPYPWLSRIC